MAGFDERRKVWIVSVIVFYEDAFVLQSDDSDPVTVVLGEGANSETKGGSGTRSRL